MSKRVHEKSHYIKIFTGFFFFSIFYWIAALSKTFTGDEFYSWVYSGKLTYSEILFLKDTGIGHPPLFHLLQKFIQDTGIFSAQVGIRVVNYFAGLVFVYFLAKILELFKNRTFYFFSLVCSAGIVNSFVLSRMWGLVLLFSTMAFFYGKKYFHSGKRTDLFALILTMFLGFFTDYSFALVVPFFILIYFSKSKYINKVVLVNFFALFSLLFMSSLLKYLTSEDGIYSLLYTLFRSSVGIFTATVYSYLNINFLEILIASIVIVQISFIIYYSQQKKDQYSNPSLKNSLIASSYVILLILTNYLIQYDIISGKYLAVIFFAATAFAIWKLFVLWKPDYNSFVSFVPISLFFAIMIILIINPWFYTSLTVPRYFIILLPFIIYFVMKVFPGSVVNSISLILLFSGVVYSFSNRVDNGYPAPNIDNTEKVLFFNPGSYASCYIMSDSMNNEIPYILRQSDFAKSCRVCQVGEEIVPFSNFDSFEMIRPSWINIEDKIPKEFILQNDQAESLSETDSFFFTYLRPMYNKYYIVDSYHKKDFR